jgi:teichoic acid transport system ATP-binding protein
MTPAQVKAQTAEIIDFSGINERGDFGSLPMKTYSSGMSARLRFSIAAAKKHDVLLIDEALATGDAKFRRRSEQRVRDLRAEAGTVFLVSHSEQSIRDTCERSIWLESGQIRADGPTEDVMKEYEAYMRK